MSAGAPPGPRRRDVVIVGAGPAGSATAAFLADAGLDVLLLDRARFPRPKPCAEYLSPEAGRVLARLGVLSEIEGQEHARLTGMRIVSPNGTSFVGRFASGHGHRGYSDYGLALPRERLDAVLAANAARRGAEFRDGVTVDAVRADGGAGEATVSGRGPGGPWQERTRFVVAADGLNSRIARKLGLARRRGRHRVALVTHAVGVSGMEDLGEMHVARRAYLGLARLGPDLTNVAIVADLSRAAPRGPAAEWFRELAAEFPEVRRRLEHASLVTPVRVVGPFGYWTRRATAHRILLVGDAADFHDPFTGEGIYSALVGAELAAAHTLRAFAATRFGAADLAPYDGARRRAFGGKWLFERVVSAAVAHPLVFNHIASRLARDPTAADLMVGAAGDYVPVSRLLHPSYVWRLVA